METGLPKPPPSAADGVREVMWGEVVGIGGGMESSLMASRIVNQGLKYDAFSTARLCLCHGFLDDEAYAVIYKTRETLPFLKSITLLKKSCLRCLWCWKKLLF